MKKVLVVDDDQALRKLYQVQLQTSGFEVVTAEDGDECLKKAESDHPDLILLDIMMPKRDGMAALKSLKDDPKFSKIPVVMLTNFGQEDLIKNALSMGAVDYLLKYKVTPAEMAEKVSLILNPANVRL